MTYTKYESNICPDVHPFLNFAQISTPVSTAILCKFLKWGACGEDDWSSFWHSICQSCSRRNVGATFLLALLVQFSTVSATGSAKCNMTSTF